VTTLSPERERQSETSVVQPELLIEEARRRARRRRLTWTAILLAILAGVASYGATRSGWSTPTSRSAAGSRAPVVTSVDLSRVGPYESLAVVGGKLILSGGPTGSLFPSASIASSPHLAASKKCQAAIVNPDTLALTDLRTGSCEDPGLYGVRVLPVNHVANGQAFASTVRIARRNPGGIGYSVGPIIMRYTEASDTNAEWIYGDGYLWIYEPTTTQGSELLQISEKTGAVLGTIPMPMISRPLLATNDDGLWFVPAISSGFTGRPTLALYHVKPGASRATIATRTVTQAHWLVANGHSIWLSANQTGTLSTLWRFDGSTARPVFHRSISSTLDYIEFGYGEPEYGGDHSSLWAVVPGRGQQIISINPNTGGTRTVATVQPRAAYSILIQPPLAVINGDAFFLDPPAQAPTYPYHRQGFSALYRITAFR
jgi:hypothetical protein